MKTRGAVKFASLSRGKQTEWAVKLGCAQSRISRLGTGRLEPKPAEIAVIAAYPGGPQPHEWLEVVTLEEKVMAEPIAAGARHLDPEVRASPEATLASANRLQALVESLQREAETHPGELEETLRITEKIASVLASLGKLTGRTVLNERQILASPAWRVIEDAMLEALHPWPDAMRSVGAALMQLRADD